MKRWGHLEARTTQGEYVDISFDGPPRPVCKGQYSRGAPDRKIYETNDAHAKMPGVGDGLNGHAADVDFTDSGNLETAVETLLNYCVDESVKSCMHA